MANKTTVKVISPGEKNYDIVKNMAKGRPSERFDWEKFAVKYNNADKGAIIIASLVSKKTQNAHKVLNNRGLITDKDYSLTFATTDLKGDTLPVHNRPALITKITNTPLKLRNEL